MTMENYLSQMGMAHKQFTDRYTEYSGPSQDQPLYYPYEPTSSQIHVNAPFKHQFVSGGHKNNAAMSALTLLAFLFFLHILQQCLKDHMVALSTPQVMVMTGGREGDEHVAKQSHNKVDKTGEIETKRDNKKTVVNHYIQTETSDDSDDRRLMKITTSVREPWKKHTQKYPDGHILNRFGNQGSSSDYFSAEQNDNRDININ